jgi:hypothetical protein
MLDTVILETVGKIWSQDYNKSSGVKPDTNKMLCYILFHPGQSWQMLHVNCKIETCGDYWRTIVTPTQHLGVVEDVDLLWPWIQYLTYVIYCKQRWHFTRTCSATTLTHSFRIHMNTEHEMNNVNDVYLTYTTVYTYMPNHSRPNISYVIPLQWLAISYICTHWLYFMHIATSVLAIVYTFDARFTRVDTAALVVRDKGVKSRRQLGRCTPDFLLIKDSVSSWTANPFPHFCLLSLPNGIIVTSAGYMFTFFELCSTCARISPR